MTTRKDGLSAREGSGPFTLTVLVTVHTRPALALARQNLSVERRGGKKATPLVEELLPIDSLW